VSAGLLFGCIGIFLRLLSNWFLPATCTGGATSLRLRTLRTTKLSNNTNKQLHHYTSTTQLTKLFQYCMLNLTEQKIIMYVTISTVYILHQLIQTFSLIWKTATSGLAMYNSCLCTFIQHQKVCWHTLHNSVYSSGSWSFCHMHLFQAAVCLSDAALVLINTVSDWDGYSLWESKPLQYVTSLQVQLSLAIPSCVDTMSTSESWGANGHTTQCTSSISVMLQHNLVSGLMAPCGSVVCGSGTSLHICFTHTTLSPQVRMPHPFPHCLTEKIHSK